MIVEQRQEQQVFWTRHLEKKKAADISRAEYCRTNNLSIHRMTYWERLLTSVETENVVGSREPGPAFIKAVVEDKESLHSAISTAGNNNLRLKFPCGLVLELNNTSDPSWVAKLIRAISGGN
jgi:hypothetical protein